VPPQPQPQPQPRLAGGSLPTKPRHSAAVSFGPTAPQAVVKRPWAVRSRWTSTPTLCSLGASESVINLLLSGVKAMPDLKKVDRVGRAEDGR
jgi:hypothetical protein